jgi:hypothetical protein
MGLVILVYSIVCLLTGFLLFLSEEKKVQ